MIIIATVVTFIFTTLLTIAGEGAAIILIPTLNFLGFDIRVAMSTALLLNSIAMISASTRYYKKNLILFKIAFPIIIVASIFSNLGAHVSHYVPNTLLNLLFVCFLIFAATKMLYSSKKSKKNSLDEKTTKNNKNLASGIVIGVVAGFAAGLLGIGGGNLILPVLIGMGIESKNASATTAFIVIFSSLSGFIGHIGTGDINMTLVFYASIASIAGALLGSWLMTDKLKSGQVKKVIAMVLMLVATKKLWNILRIFI